MNCDDEWFARMRTQVTCDVLTTSAASPAGLYATDVQLLAGGISCSTYVSLSKIGLEKANRAVCDAAVACVKNLAPDFCFTYLGWVDEQGHDTGWMGEEYLHSLDESFKCVEEIINAMDKEDIVIVIADHGGHDRGHGSQLPEDMNIPMFFIGPDFVPGKILNNLSLLDIAPTIAKIMNVPIPREWEGTAVVD